MKPFFNCGNVNYRVNWRLVNELPGIAGDEFNYAFESLAETTCMWEHRIRARWVQILHAVDNFIAPQCYGCSVGDVLRKVNNRNVSTINVPMAEAFTPVHLPSFTELNVLQRFTLIGNNFFGHRQTPIANPRHFDDSAIHSFSGKRNSANAQSSVQLSESDSIEIGLHTVHIMALSRPERDVHEGLVDDSYLQFGKKLQLLLATFSKNLSGNCFKSEDSQ
jgi:hypothetical protein